MPAGTNLSYDKYGFLVGKSKIDDEIQQAISTTLRGDSLYSAHYPVLPGHPDERKLYFRL